MLRGGFILVPGFESYHRVATTAPCRKIPLLTLDYTRNTNFAETPPVNRATSIPHAFSTTNEQKLMPMLMSPIGDLICYSDLID